MLEQRHRYKERQRANMPSQCDDHMMLRIAQLMSLLSCTNSMATSLLFSLRCDVNGLVFKVKSQKQALGIFETMARHETPESR